MSPQGFNNYPLWIANPNSIEPHTPNSWGRGNWHIFQYKFDALNVPGVSGKGDLNKFNLFQEGTQGIVVKDIQQRLKDLNESEFSPGEVTGEFHVPANSCNPHQRLHKRLIN